MKNIKYYGSQPWPFPSQLMLGFSCEYESGEIILDDGACFAIQNKGASLLLVGIIEISGNFSANQPVRILNKNKKQVAKGITSMSSDSIKNIMDKKINNIHSQIVVHRDVLALT